jgi:Druantia protein DruA
MLLASPETTQYYDKRYSKHVSVIASSMKGAAVIKTPKLVLLGTTSLYGSGSSQYNRVKIPASAIGGRANGSVMYHKVDLSVGFGTYHISSETLRYAECILARKANGRTVNSIFGEGVNPRMRKIRDAVEEIDLPSDELLLHQNARVVYGVPLAHNFSDVLLGRADRPQYILPQSKPKVRSALIAAYWRTRWLSKRILNPEVLNAVAQHRLSYPVVHGARVPLPRAEEDETLL